MDYYNLKIALSILASKDGTYELMTGEEVSFTSGFQVSFETLEDAYTPEQYNDLVERLHKAYGRVYLGVYQGHTELSLRIHDFEKAVKVGQLFKQYSIWDWKQQKEIVLWHGKEGR